jgi:hypothetical protein
LPPWNIAAVEHCGRGTSRPWNIAAVERRGRGTSSPWNIAAVEHCGRGTSSPWNIAAVERRGGSPLRSATAMRARSSPGSLSEPFFSGFQAHRL